MTWKSPKTKSLAKSNATYNPSQRSSVSSWRVPLIPIFYWQDENGKSQTDWRLFSKERLMDSEATGIQIAAYAEP